MVKERKTGIMGRRIHRSVHAKDQGMGAFNMEPDDDNRAARRARARAARRKKKKLAPNMPLTARR